jgi:hypothetical protein
MSESVFGVFQSVASVGKRASVYLMMDGRLVEKKGTIRSITNFGVLLQNSQETAFVSSETMQNFTISDDGEESTPTVWAKRPLTIS